jgi:hypothetical protein
MKFKVLSSYNLDVVCFFNTLTSDPFYLKHHGEDYNRFYPKLSTKAKNAIKQIVKQHGSTLLSTSLTSAISAMLDFNDRDIIELLSNEAEMKNSYSKYVYYNEEKWNLEYPIFKQVIPIISELESLGFKNHWKNNRLPLIMNKINELNLYLSNYNVGDMLGDLTDIKDEDCSLYLCSYTRPHGIKLCGPSFISDYSYANKTTMSISVHEMFHPPYNINNVSKEVAILSKLEHVKKAYKNQNPNSRYSPIEDFIEENIVEALGIFVCYKLGVENDPFTYFKEHDEGSHVISPDFFQYLLDNPKTKEQDFEVYFSEFVKGYKQKLI